MMEQIAQAQKAQAAVDAKQDADTQEMGQGIVNYVNERTVDALGTIKEGFNHLSGKDHQEDDAESTEVVHNELYHSCYEYSNGTLAYSWEAPESFSCDG